MHRDLALPTSRLKAAVWRGNWSPCLPIVFSIAAFVMGCGGGDDTSGLRTQVAALQTQIASSPSTATATATPATPPATLAATAEAVPTRALDTPTPGPTLAPLPTPTRAASLAPTSAPTTDSARLTASEASKAMENVKTPSGKLVGACGGRYTTYRARYEGGGWWRMNVIARGDQLRMRWNEETSIAEFFDVPPEC